MDRAHHPRRKAQALQKLLTPSIVEAVVSKVNQKRITNSKDLRKLRTSLPDPIARAQFQNEAGDIDSAMLRVAAPEKLKQPGLAEELQAVIGSMKAIPWTTLQEMKSDPELIRQLDDAENTLSSLRKAIS